MKSPYSREREFVLAEASRMEQCAADYRRLGYTELARWLDQTAEQARRWANSPKQRGITGHFRAPSNKPTTGPPR